MDLRSCWELAVKLSGAQIESIGKASAVSDEMRNKLHDLHFVWLRLLLRKRWTLSPSLILFVDSLDLIPPGDYKPVH